MANFTAPILLAAVGTSYVTAGFPWSVGTKRAQVYEVEFSQNGVLPSTDAQCQWDISRALTNSSTGTTVAANLLDTADYTAATLYANNFVNQPTVTTVGNGLNLKNWAINMRGSYRWRALDDGDNIIIQATAGAGLAVRVLSAQYASTAVGNLSFIER